MLSVFHLNPPRASRIGLFTVLACTLAACGTAPAAPPVETNPVAPSISAPSPTPPPPLTVTPVQPPPVQPPVALDSETRPVPDVITALLTYAERLRVLNPTDLAAEIVVLGDPGNVPLRQMQLALALMHTHQPVDTARALGLVQRVVGHPGPESLQLKPLARLMAERLSEMRRLEETTERQTQQLRESQRRIEQLNERLEAMRAIERSLNSRPSAAPVPPASAPAPARPATP
ncbi:hypothetical protein [Hydrogenophaga sp.]|jgi:hypothetical protein|uniref:hypothetical protein n=1 Tax=Hydrogenophaga sp. TaxID=1904254 RepID=UPI003F717327